MKIEEIDYKATIDFIENLSYLGYSTSDFPQEDLIKLYIPSKKDPELILFNRNFKKTAATVDLTLKEEPELIRHCIKYPFCGSGILFSSHPFSQGSLDEFKNQVIEAFKLHDKEHHIYDQDVHEIYCDGDLLSVFFSKECGSVFLNYKNDFHEYRNNTKESLIIALNCMEEFL